MLSAEKLKLSILQEAIQGKLVPQLEDEPAVEIEGIAPEEAPFAIPEKWKWVQLKQICSYIQRGKSPKYSDVQQYPVISQKCNQRGGVNYRDAKFINPFTVESYDGNRILKNGDLLLNSTGTGTLGRIGQYCLKKNPWGWAVVDSHITVIRCQKNIANSCFLLKYIEFYSIQKKFELLASGSTNQKELSLQTVKTYLVPLPPLAEQERIVARLNELMPLVEQYGQSQTALMTIEQTLPEKLRASILQEAIQGKLVPQLEDEPAVEIEGITSEEAPFAIPEKWKWRTIKDVLDRHIGGGTPSKFNSEYWNGDIPWASVKDLQGDRLVKTKDYITRKGLENSASNLIPAGNLIICMRMAIGKIVYNNIDVAINQDLRALFLNKIIDKDYFYFFYKTINISGSGVTVKGIKIAEILAQPIPIPPLAEQKRIVERIQELLKLVDDLAGSCASQTR